MFLYYLPMAHEEDCNIHTAILVKLERDFYVI